ncbi:hypothetical protein NQ176_g10452 [Zarea fungicola]|uniref:Uncharacterized protein n=1 Tax=Zarea fungicola TaxID=93591 RepID=A0ACC1MGJ3_9HYPO|nr:hypothetical protein NQ176_g10452 [Lecanicillium fungicola]
MGRGPPMISFRNSSFAPLVHKLHPRGRHWLQRERQLQIAKPKAIWKNARAAYVKHYETIRATVPKEQLLEYRLTDGWEPLAKFLGKEAPGPEVPFPHVNDAKEFKKVVAKGARYFLKKATKNFFRPCFWLGCSHEGHAR